MRLGRHVPVLAWFVAAATGCTPAPLPARATGANQSSGAGDPGAPSQSAAPSKSVTSPPASPPFRFAPREAAQALVDCSLSSRVYVDTLEGRHAVSAHAMPFSIRREGEGTTLRIGASSLLYFEIDGVDADGAPSEPLPMAGSTFQIGPSRVVRRAGSSQPLRGRLVADVLGVVGPFTELFGKLPKAQVVVGPMGAAVADLFVSQVVGLSPLGATPGPGTASVLSAEDYDGTTLVRIEFSAPLTWSRPGALPSEVVGEALVRLNGLVHSVSARALNRPLVKRDVGDAEVALHLRCRDSGEEAPQ